MTIVDGAATVRGQQNQQHMCACAPRTQADKSPTPPHRSPCLTIARRLFARSLRSDFGIGISSPPPTFCLRFCKHACRDVRS